MESFRKFFGLKTQKLAAPKQNLPDKLEDDGNIFESNIWLDFVKVIRTSINNRSLNKFPLALLNPDYSITFVFHKCNEPNCKDCQTNSEHEKALTNLSAINEIDCQRKKFGFLLTGNSKQLFEAKVYDEYSNTLEYTFNISPEHLDSILKLSHDYSYRGEGSILKLTKNFDLKPGVLRLFPVLPLDENTYIMRAAGCQITEMPSVQLLHLLPDYSGKQEHFHYIPKEVEVKLRLGQEDISHIITEVLTKQKMLDENNKIRTGGEEILIRAPNLMNGTDPKIVIVDIDENSKDFYLLYGNVNEEELRSCKSVEMSTLTFLEEFKKILLVRHERASINEQQKILESINRIDKMIQKEMGLLQQSKSVSIASSIFGLISSTDRKKEINSQEPIQTEPTQTLQNKK